MTNTILFRKEEKIHERVSRQHRSIQTSDLTCIGYHTNDGGSEAFVQGMYATLL